MSKSLCSFCVLIFMITLPAVANETAKAAHSAILICQMNAALDLDDGISDVSSIAPVVAQQCKKESDYFYALLRNSTSGLVYDAKVREIEEQNTLDLARSAILSMRSEKRKRGLR